MAATAIKPIRDLMKVIQPIVDGAGASCHLEGGTGAHPRLYIELNGRQQFTPLSTSPRTVDQSIKYKISDVRRILRELSA